MELSEFDQYEIKAYFKIDERIRKIRNGINGLRKSFYDQTLVSHIGYHGDEVVSVGFSVETNVISFVDTLISKRQSIERLLKRKRYLNDYLNSLEPSVKDYLINKYSRGYSSEKVQQADLDLLNEIHEINDAINFMYGFPVELHEKTIENTNLEDDFQDIASMLGV